MICSCSTEDEYVANQSIISEHCNHNLAIKHKGHHRSWGEIDAKTQDNKKEDSNWDKLDE